MMQYRKLGKTGLNVSVIGYGASPLGNAFGEVAPQQGIAAVHRAIDQGINLFDVSPYYGLTLAETRLGEALKGHRERVILMTKCGRYGMNEFDFSRKRIRRSVEESLARLRTDHLDILLAHDIEFGEWEQIRDETFPALRELKLEGKTRFIGASALPLGILRQAAEQGELDLILSYCHYNLMIQDLDDHLAPTVNALGLGLINASPLHMGLLTTRDPPDWHPAPPDAKQAAREVVDYCKSKGLNVSAVALRFCLDYSDVASTLIGMGSPTEVEANLAELETATDPALLAQIRMIVGSRFNVTWPSGRAENNLL